MERIRKLERSAYSIWRDRCAEPRDDFEEIFVTLCRRYDSPDWDTDVLRSALESEIAGVLDVSIHTVRVMLDAELAGRQLVIPEIPEIEEELEEESSEPDSNAACLLAVDAPQDDACSEVSSADPVPGDEVSRDVPDHTDPGDVLDLNPGQDDNGVTDSPAPVTALSSVANDTGSHDLKSLRGRAWTLAARLAQRNGMSELVEPVSGKGLGFVLRDVPDPTLADQLDEDSLSQLCMLWWQLAACAEMTYAPLESILPLLPAESILRRALETEDADLLFNSIWTLDPGHTGYRLWRPLDDRDWSDLLGLMDTYRCIRRNAADTGVSIWE